MSALGQKQTFGPRNAMSALPPKSGPVKQGGFQLTSGRALAVGLIEAIDVFPIAIVALVIGLGLHRLFVDEPMPLPRWLKIDDLEDLKGYLVSIVIAVLAVLFLRQAVERAGDLDLLSLAAAL